MKTCQNQKESIQEYTTEFKQKAVELSYARGNAEEFELVYGFPPDLDISTNSPADSNGDDNLELVDPFEG